jgi:hypothetical protein
MADSVDRLAGFADLQARQQAPNRWLKSASAGSVGSERNLRIGDFRQIFTVDDAALDRARPDV